MRTYAQIPIGEDLPKAISGKEFVTIVTDQQDEPTRDETPEGYRDVSYIPIEVERSVWDAARASHDDVALAKAQATTDVFEAVIELFGGT